MFWLIVEVVLFILIMIPTLVALFTGAPWVPTPLVRVRRILELAEIKTGDRVYDLGCGDGRMVHLASKEFGADAIGLELSPLIYLMGRVRNFLVRSKSKILWRDFRSVDYSNANAIVCYLLPEILKVMRPKFERELAPGTRVVSYAFRIDGWEPSYTEPKNREKNYSPIFVYTIPSCTNEKGTVAPA